MNQYLEIHLGGENVQNFKQLFPIVSAAYGEYLSTIEPLQLVNR